MLSSYLALRFYPAIMAMATILLLSLSLSSFWVGCSGLPTPACGGGGLEPNKTPSKTVGLFQYVSYLSTADLSKHLKINADPGSLKCAKQTRNKIQVYLFNDWQYFSQGVTRRCRLSWLTNSALTYESKCGGKGGSSGSQPMSTAAYRSPNKLWISTSIFNIWLQRFSTLYKPVEKFPPDQWKTEWKAIR